MTDEELLKVADAVYAKLEDRFHALDGVVGARGRRGEDGKLGPLGIPGRDAERGPAGLAGYSTRVVIVYKLTETPDNPAPPSGGTWDFMSNTVTPPEGWLAAAPNHTDGYLWQSQAIFSSNGELLDAWTQPFRLNSKDGADGADSFFIEYVYTLTKDLNTIPDIPENNPDVDDFTGNWSDNPKGITEDLRCEWVCSRLRQADGKWGNWIGPTRWSVWGNAGKDGDGMQYIYKVTKTKDKPDTPTEIDPETQPIELTNGWTDDPKGVDEENQFEWVSQRKFNGEELKWGNWTEPRLWASWGLKGDTGLSATFRFQAMVKDAEKPVIEDRKRPEPGVQWSKLLPELEPGKVIWACLALVYEDGTIYCDETLPEEKQGWLGPWLISGADGERGPRGVEPDYPCIVFKKSDIMPTKPTGLSATAPGDGWLATVPADSTSDNWWGCWGLVTHQDNPEYNEKEDPEDEAYLTSVSWGSPLPINGNMGLPCVLACGLLRFSGDGTTIERESKTIGVDSITANTYRGDNGKGGSTDWRILCIIRLTPVAGYTVKIFSANVNTGSVAGPESMESSWTIKEGDRRGHHGHHVSLVLIVDDHTVNIKDYHPANDKNDSWNNGDYGKDVFTSTFTLFGTVTPNK